MTEAKHSKVARDYRVPAGSPLAQAWKIALVLGVVGAVIAAVGYTLDPRRFTFAYLMGFIIVLTMAFGSMFFVLIQHLTGAGWSVTVRRGSEFFVAGIVIVPLLALPVLVGAEQLYPWWNLGHDHGVAHAQEPGHGHDGAHGSEVLSKEKPGSNIAHEPGHHSPEHAMHAEITQKKLGYLNSGFFYIRAVIYLLVWLFLARRLFGWSTAQDANGDPQWTVKLQRFSTWGVMLFALSLTFAAFDWVMSLIPNWYSTMFGVRMFAASAVLGLALNVLLGLALRRSGATTGVVTVEHFHDLGKLMFGFLVFWAYISFSEFFLIWYAAIPEETIYFHMRWDYPWWQGISIAIVVSKFIIPFFLIMSRNVKRNVGVLGLGAAWICVMHLVEMYYWIMPHYREGEVAFSLTGVATDVGCVMACVGLYLAVVFRRMLNYSAIPVRDPRLERAINFVNA